MAVDVFKTGRNPFVFNYFSSQSTPILGLIVAAAFVSLARDREEKLKILTRDLTQSLGILVEAGLTQNCCLSVNLQIFVPESCVELTYLGS